MDAMKSRILDSIMSLSGYIVNLRRLKWIFFLVIAYTLARQLHIWVALTAHHQKMLKGCDVPQHRVFLLAIPNTGTSTTASMVWRYALVHKLTAILPTANPELKQQKFGMAAAKSLVPPYHTGVTELLFSKNNAMKFLDRNTPYITMLRHPMSHLKWTFRDGSEKYVHLKLKDYLDDPVKYEEQWKQFDTTISLTNNPFARFLGLHPDDFKNISLINDLITSIGKDFTMVLILENLDESLVVLRRLMCWSFKDIVYNVEYKQESEQETKVPEKLINKHRAWALADYTIYEHFSNKMKEYIVNGGDKFAREVSEFKKTLLAVNNFCNHVLDKDEFLDIGTNEWGGKSKFVVNDCMLLLSSSQSLRNMIRDRDGLPLEVETS